MKKALVILEVCGIIALVLAVVNHIKKSKKGKKSQKGKKSGIVPEENMKDEVFEDNVTDEVIEDGISVEQKRENVASTISERHKAFEQIIRDTLSENKEYDINDSENKQDFDEIDRDLDGLLDEE